MRAGLLTVAIAMALVAPTLHGAARDKDKARLTLTGCVVAGEAKNSFVVTNAVVGGEDAMRAPANSFFRLESGKALKSHVGHQVELIGEADLNDMDKGELKIKTDDAGKTTAAIKSERETVKAEVGKDSGLVPSVMVGSEGSMHANIATYKFKVSKVRMLSDRCSG